MTYREHFMRLHPKALCFSSGAPEDDPCSIYGHNVEICPFDEECTGEKCEAYWNSEMPTMTNGDRIRSMADEELVDMFKEFKEGCICCFPDKLGCCECIMEWLKQEAES